MSVDPRLLNKSRSENENDEKEFGQGVRKNKAQAKKGKNQEGESRNNETDRSNKNLRQLLGRKKKKKDADKKEEEKDNSGFLTRPSKRLLRWSWISILITGGTSIVLSLGYLNFHAFFRMILPRFFCRFGEEWKPPRYKGRDPFSKFSSKGLGVTEVLILIWLDFLVVATFAIVVATVLTIVIIIYKLFNWFTGFFG